MDAAPLISIPEAPTPEGGAAEWFEGEGGLRLRAALFPAQTRVRGSVVLSPGRTEPLEKYFEVIEDLQRRGFTVLIHDWRGQGLSARMLEDRRRGHAVGLWPFLEDYRRLLKQFEDRLPKPWIAMGHSMGGCLTLSALIAGKVQFAGAILSAPMLGLITDQKGGYPLARALTFVASHIGLSGRYLFGDPSDPLTMTFERDRIAHDRARWDRFHAQLRACPDLAIGNLTWGWLEFALNATARFRRKGLIEKIPIPVTIVAAGDDDRVLTSASAAIAARLRKGRYVEIPGSWHEVLMETDDIRNVFWAEFDRLAGEVAP